MRFPTTMDTMKVFRGTRPVFELDPCFCLPVGVSLLHCVYYFLFPRLSKLWLYCLFQRGGVTVVLGGELTAAHSFLSDLRGSKDALFCLLLFSCFGPPCSEAIILYCFYLPRTAEGESKCIYKMDQTLPPLTHTSKRPEDSSMSTWRQSWSWSRAQTNRSPEQCRGLR